MNLTTIKERIRELVPTAVEDELLDAWINLGQTDCAREARIEVTDATQSTTTGDATYNVPTDAYEILEVYIADVGTLESIDLPRLLIKKKNSTDNGTPKYYCTFGSTLEIYPAPTSTYTTKTITIYYYDVPTDLSPASATPAMPTRYHDILIWYGAHMAALYEEQFTLAASLYQKYEYRKAEMDRETYHRHMNRYGTAKHVEMGQ